MMGKKKQSNQVLGLSFEGRRLEGAIAKRIRGGSYRVQTGISRELSLNPLADDPELVGREIKDQLAESGLSEKHCVVGIPLEWTLTNLIKLPDVPEEHLSGFIRLQAEKGFPFGLEDLSVSVSRVAGDSGENYALITAVPRKHIDLLDRTLGYAGLKPVSFSLGILALDETQGQQGDNSLMLFVNAEGVAVLVRGQGGIVSLRSLKDAFIGDEPVRRLNGQAVARELRITLGQIPAGVRQRLKKIRILGATGLASTLATEITAKANALGLEVEAVAPFQPNGSPVNLPISGSISPALALATRYLEKPAQTLEYLPPKVSQWARIAKRLASRKAGILGGVAGAVVLVSAIALYWQHRTLSRLEAQWSTMGPAVAEIEVIQDKVRKFRSWYDESQPTLRILKALSEAFPENDSITAKTLEIRDQSKVSFTGISRDNKAVFNLGDSLRALPQVQGLKVENVRGKSPLQFTVSFKWVEGGAQ